MNAGTRRAATAARLSSRPVVPEPSPARDEPVDEAPPELGRRIRGTYLLYPATYRALEQRRAEAAVEIGEVRVTWQDAIEAALRLVETDETVRRRWLGELRALAREKR